MSRSFLFGSLAALMFLSGCASSEFRERHQRREQLAQSKGLYCGFISGDEFPDLDVELNLVMANKCDPNRPFSVTPYKNSSAKNGVIYCCNMARSADSQLEFKSDKTRSKNTPAVTEAPVVAPVATPAPSADMVAPAAKARTATKDAASSEAPTKKSPTRGTNPPVKGSGAAIVPVEPAPTPATQGAGGN